VLKRLRKPAKPPEPSPSDNPLGEWYADIDFIDREPFVVMLNAATGASLVVPGRAHDLRVLHVNAGQQLSTLLHYFGVDLEQPKVVAELKAWDCEPQPACTRDRSVLASLRRVKEDAWHHFACQDRSLPAAAAQQWEGIFTHPSLPNVPGLGRYHRPLELVLERLLPGPGRDADMRPRMH
jgi:hypothetical protein